MIWCSGRAAAPVYEELGEDHQDADKHGEPHQDETPAEHGEAIGLSRLRTLLQAQCSQSGVNTECFPPSTEE